MQHDKHHDSASVRLILCKNNTGTNNIKWMPITISHVLLIKKVLYNASIKQ